MSGQELAARAHTQAQKFGADVVIANSAAALSCARKPYAIELEDGQRVPARTIIIATGAGYRKLPIENLSRFEGAGVYYAATFMEGQLCRGEDDAPTISMTAVLLKTRPSPSAPRNRKRELDPSHSRIGKQGPATWLLSKTRRGRPHGAAALYVAISWLD